MKIEQYIKNNYNFVRVTNNKGFSVTLCDLGASLYSIIFNDKEMTFVPEKLEDFLRDDMYHGKTIGRVANRIKGNKVIIDKKEYKLENNEGENTLHGGLHGLSTKVFNYRIEEREKDTKVIFAYLFKDLEDGLPGNTSIEVIYTIYEGRKDLQIDLISKSDKNTVFSLTNHSYFNLGEEDLSTLSLQIKASLYLETNPIDLLGIMKKPCQNYLNFNKFKKITENIDNKDLLFGKANGYDHFLYFDEFNPLLNKVSLKSDTIEMDIYTDYSGVQIYSDNYVDVKGRGTSKSRRRALAIEPSKSHLDLHYLDKDETYHHFILYKFRRII